MASTVYETEICAAAPIEVRLSVTSGVYHLHGKSGWNGTRFSRFARPESLAARKKTITICFTKRALPRCRGSHFEKSEVKGGKRGRGKPGGVRVDKWYRNVPVISVGTGKEEYV